VNPPRITIACVVGHVTGSTAAPLAALPNWATLVRAPNPGPMTLDGTNTWVLRAPGSVGCVVVDPGPLDEGHLAAVGELGPITAILLTHNHEDHSEGVPRLSELTGAPVNPPALDTDLLIETLVTPGHTADSLSFVVSLPDGSQRAVLTGDTVLGRGTTVVAYPDGNLGDYLASLRVLATFPPGTPALPGHGPALDDVAAAATYYLHHREQRLDQVRAALAAGDETAEQVVARVYADVDHALWWAAELSVRAQLDFLRRESQPPTAELDEP
jgi:glyoxylase-like metal-dependent hydrolase (beta-lactamase superfamily II)